MLQFQRHGFGDHHDRFPGLVEYRQGWDFQREVHALVAAGEVPDQCLYVQHEPVYTAGRRTLPEERPFDGTPVVDVDRGGKITWHGPGQLVGYPIVKLTEGIGVVDYVRRVEEAVIRWLAGLDVVSGRIPERTGVWLAAGDGKPERKICAIGIRVSKRTTLHGFALNLSNELQDFGNIIPCGISDAGVGRLADEITGPVPSLDETADGLEPLLAELLAFEPYRMSPDLERTPGVGIFG
ncbi:lipoyl(octanoyl) transferase LipB [Aestuariimicrobium kwangyangense]|uniref:lipoyl(octanoyl) transferase LipB n=1 Tax=Aestuariimicrobium kwangyangense TaxID=396389 RepID=UPI0003B50A33|nr:lipoyl(octanoyl) transferase LipB [Aestuariimicrobium kwangyangense]